MALVLPTADLHPEELIGRTFLMSPHDDGTRKREVIVGYLDEFDGDLERQPDRIQFKVEVGNDESNSR